MRYSGQITNNSRRPWLSGCEAPPSFKSWILHSQLSILYFSHIQSQCHCIALWSFMYHWSFSCQHHPFAGTGTSVSASLLQSGLSSIISWDLSHDFIIPYYEANRPLWCAVTFQSPHPTGTTIPEIWTCWRIIIMIHPQGKAVTSVLLLS